MKTESERDGAIRVIIDNTDGLCTRDNTYAASMEIPGKLRLRDELILWLMDRSYDYLILPPQDGSQHLNIHLDFFETPDRVEDFVQAAVMGKICGPQILLSDLSPDEPVTFESII